MIEYQLRIVRNDGEPDDLSPTGNWGEVRQVYAECIFRGAGSHVLRTEIFAVDTGEIIASIMWPRQSTY